MVHQAPEEYYHVYNRGIQKQIIFRNDSDRFRFLFLLLVLQGGVQVKNISREVKQSVQNRILHIDSELVDDVVKNRSVELVLFCFMPNHFHIMVKEIEEGGIAKYMQRVLIAYTKYFNTKYEVSGHLFQSSYKSILMEDDVQLMHLSAYIHKNPSELQEWKGREEHYLWSSYHDCLFENRFEKLLVPDIVMDRYEKEKTAYKKFVVTSKAKENQKSLNL